MYQCDSASCNADTRNLINHKEISQECSMLHIYYRNINIGLYCTNIYVAKFIVGVTFVLDCCRCTKNFRNGLFLPKLELTTKKSVQNSGVFEPY